MKPSSFATLCTSNCAFELTGLLLSLSLFHPNETIYIMSDTKTKKIIEEMTPQPKLNIKWFLELDKYDGMNRQIMEEKKIWSEFQMGKARIIKYSLENEKDTLFLDSDIIITDVINDIDNSKELGVSPQFIRQEHIDNTGYYNGGCIWTKNKNVPDDWIEFTKTSRYVDQASIEDLVKKYSYFEFGENYNLQCWRMYLSDESSKQIASHIKSSPNRITYKDKPLKFVHTHFLDKRFDVFNRVIIAHLKNARMYKLLIIIYRVINNKWILKIPEQPMTGLAYHNNDSYRELAKLIQQNTEDVEIKYENKSIHCWLEPNIITYDRPTLEWVNNELYTSSLILLGNGDINNEGVLLKNKIPKLNIKPWIFWPRSPNILENILKQGILSYKNRNIQSIFIGNYENSVQEKYRNSAGDLNWNKVVSEYHCTKGNNHKFSNKEYLLKLRQSRFGLCLRGYGSKCHREVELMAFGTVPIVTSEVTTNSYMEPLQENIHYLQVKNTDEFKNKIDNLSENDWNTMSESCYKWYERNVLSSNCWTNMIENILYT